MHGRVLVATIGRHHPARYEPVEGQAPGYVHSIEADFFEAIHYAAGTPATAYGGSMHDWYGIPDKSCGHGLCQVSMPYRTGMRLAPIGTDFDQFHRYGFLWMPATASSVGYAEFYFDGERVGPTQQWQLFAEQPPPLQISPGHSVLSIRGICS